MRSAITPIALAAAILMWLTAPVFSDTTNIRNFRVGNWFAGAYAREGAFSHCAATASYKSGVSVLFSISRNYAWSIGFINSDWHYDIGHRMTVVFAVDNLPSMKATGVAATSRMIEIELKDSSALFNLFKKGQILRVAGTKSVFEFNLTGTSQLLDSLLQCVVRKGQPPAPVEVGTLTAPQRNEAISLGDSNAKAEAVAFAANLLSSANVSGYRMLGPSESPEIKAHARWIAPGPIFGTMDVRQSMTVDGLKGLPGELIGRDARSCKGAFLSGAIPDDDKTSMGRVFTTCDMNGKVFVTYYLAIARPAGGAYIISTISFSSEKPAKEMDASIRSAVFDVIPKN